MHASLEPEVSSEDRLFAAYDVLLELAARRRARMTTKGPAKPASSSAKTTKRPSDKGKGK